MKMQTAIILFHLLAESEPLFNSESEKVLRENHPDATFFSLDNFSELIIAKYALQLIEHSERTYIIGNAQKQDSQLNTVLQFLNKLGKSQSEVKSIMIGKHPVAVKLLKKYSVFLGQSDEPKEILSVIQKDFSN